MREGNIMREMNRSASVTNKRPRVSTGARRQSRGKALHAAARDLPAMVALAALTSLFGARAVDAASSAIYVPNGTTDLTSLGTSLSTKDVAFSSSTTYSPSAFTINSTMTVGSLDDLDAGQLLSISNTGSTASILNLNNPTGNSNSIAPLPYDPFYVASGASLNISNGATAPLNIVLNVGGSFDIAGAANIGSNVSGSGYLFKIGAGTLTLSGSNAYTGGTYIAGGTLSLDFSAASPTLTSNLVAANGLNLGFTFEHLPRGDQSRQWEQ